MKESYRAGWLLLLLWTSGGIFWSMTGRALFRRTFAPVPPIEDSARKSDQFLAVLFPRLSEEGGRFAMSDDALDEVLRGLQAQGYRSIGLEDIRALFARRRLLPAKSVLLAFDQDSPRGIDAADRALARRRMRGVVFTTHIANTTATSERRFLSPHAVGQLLKSGAWELGWGSRDAAASVPEREGVIAGLDAGPPAPSGTLPLRFIPSDFGLNDHEGDPRSLRILTLKPGLTGAESMRVIVGTWPRRAAFRDDFASDGLGLDWINGWGSVSVKRRRLALIATPRTTGAAIFLRGTEKWRDVVLEFELRKYKAEFWAYARRAEDGRFLRFGTRDGQWYLEQKTSASGRPTQLARAPILDGALPARIRLILKDDWAIVQVNGRMQFGRALRVNPAVDRGRIEFGVYDPLKRTGLALLKSVRANPVDTGWLVLKDEGTAELDRHLDGIRDEALSAYAISPRWMEIRPDGAVLVSQGPRDIISSLAGFYRCRLIPMADFPAEGAAFLGDPAAERRLRSDLVDLAGEMQAKGINLRLGSSWAQTPPLLHFLGGLRRDLHSRRIALWITLKGTDAAGPALWKAVDGILGPANRAVPGLELLEAADPEAVRPPGGAS